MLKNKDKEPLKKEVKKYYQEYKKNNKIEYVAKAKEDDSKTLRQKLLNIIIVFQIFLFCLIFILILLEISKYLNNYLKYLVILFIILIFISNLIDIFIDKNKYVKKMKINKDNLIITLLDQKIDEYNLKKTKITIKPIKSNNALFLKDYLLMVESNKKKNFYYIYAKKNKELDLGAFFINMRLIMKQEDLQNLSLKEYQKILRSIF